MGTKFILFAPSSPHGSPRGTKPLVSLAGIKLLARFLSLLLIVAPLGAIWLSPGSSHTFAS